MAGPKLHSAFDLPLPASARPDVSTRPRVPIEDDVLGLFEEHGAPLFRYIRSFGLDTETAEDLLQDVFLSLFRHLQLDRPRHNLRAWLFQVGHNLSLRQRDQQRRRQRYRGDWALTTIALDPESNPEEQLVGTEQQRLLRSALRSLPERDQQCLYLRSEGFRYREIARTLGISLGSVAKSVARAMARLTIVERG